MIAGAVDDRRLARYLAWWLADHEIGDGEDDGRPRFVADGDAHEVCRARALLVDEVRDGVGRWWITEAGLELARSVRPPPSQLALFDPCPRGL